MDYIHMCTYKERACMYMPFFAAYLGQKGDSDTRRWHRQGDFSKRAEDFRGRPGAYRVGGGGRDARERCRRKVSHTTASHRLGGSHTNRPEGPTCHTGRKRPPVS